MRLRGSSSWVPLTIAVRLVRWLGIQGAAGHGAEHRQHAVPHAGTARVGGPRPERDWRAGRVDVLPAAGMRETELLRGGRDAIGGAVARELGQELVVLGAETRLFLLQRRERVARLGGGGWLCDEQQGGRARRHRADRG